LLERFKAIGIQYLCPDINVIAGGIMLTFKNVPEVG
jgi:hypothetical protein